MTVSDTNPSSLADVVDPDRWQLLERYVKDLVDSSRIPALAVQVQSQGILLPPLTVGLNRLEEPQPIGRDTRFLIASLTKPLIATAILLLIERGRLTLNQRISELVPQFRTAGKRTITLHHLLTHTSGLPDMLPDNRELRAAQTPLSAFVDGAAVTDLLFSPGQNAQYQSMGFAVLGPIIEAATDQPYQQFVSENLFKPLQMRRAALCLNEQDLADQDIAEVRVPHDQVGEVHWNWNSEYWKRLGAPWGGAFASVEDLSKFCQFILNRGRTNRGEQLLSSELVDLATTNRLHDFPDIPESVRRTRGWGFGWRLNWRDHRGSFGDMLSDSVCGHWGATGTLMWIDRASNSAAVILGTQPYDRQVSPLVNVSNLIVAALKSRR